MAQAGSPCASYCVLNARLLLPDIECLVPDHAIGVSCEEMPAWMKVSMDESMSG